LLTGEFEYRERLLEFTELQGIHSGENLAIAVENMLIELGIEDKLISITGDNASNNESMASELYFSLSDRPRVEDTTPAPLYRGLDSYIRCLAHVLNRIVKDILRTLGSGTMEQAQVACDCLQTGNSITEHSAIGKLRVLALWINRSPQRRQKWKEICRLNNLPDKFVAYDVATRWNSTFRMVDDGLNSRQQVNKFLNLQEELPPFTLKDWSQLEQIHTVLHKFNELTLFISKRNRMAQIQQHHQVIHAPGPVQRPPRIAHAPPTGRRSSPEPIQSKSPCEATNYHPGMELHSRQIAHHA
jgi:hypothetical protein